MSDLIKAGDVVVIRLHDETSCYILKAEGDQKIGRSRVSVKGMIGYPYGSVFEVCDRKVKYVTQDINYEELNITDAYDNVKGDNSKYNDSNTAQKLTTADINQLRETGASSEDIIKSLIANSDTWSSKTVFAQEKWLKKKQQKYAKRFRVLKSTPTSICEVYNNKNKDKTCGIRVDTLSQIIYQSGIHAGSKVLIFESILGLMVGTAAYQLQGYGQILACYDGQQPHFEIVNSLNLSDTALSIIQPVPSFELASAVDDVLSAGFLEMMTEEEINEMITNTILKNNMNTTNSSSSSSSSSSSEQQANKKMKIESTNISSSSITTDINDDNHDKNDDKDNNSSSSSMAPVKRHNTSGRQYKDLIRVRQKLREGSTNLIIASKYHPLPILKETLTLLGPNSPLVVYSEFMEPLVECFLYLQQRGDVLRIRLNDTWCREYQTLPNRVHPQMYMSVSGGYLLTGIYVGIITPTNMITSTNNTSGST